MSQRLPQGRPGKADDRRWFGMGAAANTKHHRSRYRRIDARALSRDEPVSRAAVLARRASLFALALAAISVGLIRFRAVEVPAGLAILAAALVFAVAAFPLAAVAFAVIWRTGRRGIRISAGGCFLAALVTAYPAYLGFRARHLPMVSDVSTDIADPPAFSRATTAFAGRDGELPGNDRRATPALQAKFFSDLHPIVVDMEPYDVYELIQRLSTELHWTIVSKSAPGGREGIGHVDAVDRTPVMGLPDDIAIRIQPLGDGSRVDMRSASRFGIPDFGANAARIRRFAEALDNEVAPR